MKAGFSAVTVALLLAIVAVCALAADRPHARWEYGIYTERTGPNLHAEAWRHSWQAKGGGVSASQRSEVYRHLGYNVGDKADPPVVTLLDHLSSLGWELLQVVPESHERECRYFFRRPVDEAQR